MSEKTPHIVQYQGSKRLLAKQILSFMPTKFCRLIEPFAGMAAISIATAQEDRAQQFIINDINEPIVKILKTAIENPFLLIDQYTEIWNEQFTFSAGHIQHFYYIRNKFNEGNQNAPLMLYLLARCVKGAVRYSGNGNFNQSPDKRRHGVNPKNIASNISAISSLLKDKTEFYSLDYHEILEMARPGDLVYMDPPYQGVSDTRDHRYCSGVSFNEFTEALTLLNRKNIDYLISYDGECGGKVYGVDLPIELGCKKILLNAGLSAQATLLGKRYTTLESLYISRQLSHALIV